MQHFPRLTNRMPSIPTTSPQQFTSGMFQADGLSQSLRIVSDKPSAWNIPDVNCCGEVVGIEGILLVRRGKCCINPVPSSHATHPLIQLQETLQQRLH